MLGPSYHPIHYGCEFGCELPWASPNRMIQDVLLTTEY